MPISIRSQLRATSKRPGSERNRRKLSQGRSVKDAPGLATKADLEALRAALRADVAALETHLTVRMVAVGGLIVAAVKLL